MMESGTRKVLFLCYLFLSSLTITIAQQVAITDEIANDIAEDFLQQFQKDIDVLAEKAPENPDNDIDGEDQGRAFFLLPLLPKLAIILVKVAIKVAPLVIKAAVAIKAKAVAVAAATAAKVSTTAALKATAITVGKKVLADVAIGTVVDVVADKVTDYLSSDATAAPAVAAVGTTKAPNIFDHYEMDSEVCRCPTKDHCNCCIHPKEFEPGCLNITLTESLWEKGSEIKVGTFYGGKEIMTRTMEVGQPGRKCHTLSDPFSKVNMCVSVFGRSVTSTRASQCFSVFFNARGLSKCVSQGKDKVLRFLKSDK